MGGTEVHRGGTEINGGGTEMDQFPLLLGLQAYCAKAYFNLYWELCKSVA